MFERFTCGARQVVVRAEQEARELDHPVILAGHIVLATSASAGTGGRALARVGFRRDEAKEALTRSVGTRLATLSADDAEALRTVGIDVDEVRRAVESAFGTGALDRRDPRRKARRPPFGADAKRALEGALREAIRLGDRHIGSEHLLLGVVLDDGSSGAAVLRRQGITPDAVRAAVATETAAGGPGRTASGGRR